jgi:hypothetical protein
MSEMTELGFFVRDEGELIQTVAAYLKQWFPSK